MKLLQLLLLVAAALYYASESHFNPVPSIHFPDAEKQIQSQVIEKSPAQKPTVQKETFYPGQTEQEVRAKAGLPDQKAFSPEGYEWWIYNKDPAQYMQIGIQNGMVVDFFTRSPLLSWKGLHPGMSRSGIEKHISFEAKVKLNYEQASVTIQNDLKSRPLAVLDGIPVIFYLDTLGQNRVMAVRLLSPEILLRGRYYPFTASFLGKSPDFSTPVLSPVSRQTADRDSEKQLLDLVNSSRLENHLATLSWHEKAAVTARQHSTDMRLHSYFDHVSKTTGLNPFERLEKNGIVFTAAGENIAAGQPDAIEAWAGWMNSAGHRKNILNPLFTSVGMGVDDRDYTQDFLTPR